MKTTLALSGIVAVGSLGLGCASFIGIEDAEHDPTTSGATTVGSGGSGGGATSSSGAAGASTCPNGAVDGDETDLDCGGGDCPPCGIGDTCKLPTDCETRVCEGGECKDATCDDGVSNGTETGVDCGGNDGCPPCGFGQGCRGNPDCVAAATCTMGICAPAPIGVWQILFDIPAQQSVQFGRLAYDSVRKETIQFGGFQCCDTYNDETFTLGAGTWTKENPTGSPSARSDSGMAFDVDRGVVVLHGGSTFGVYLSDTWEWDGDAKTWTLREDDGPVGVRRGQGLIYDTDRHVTVLFGGYAVSSFANDTWEWDGSTWTYKMTQTSPEPRAEVAMVYDSLRKRVVLYGGWDGTKSLDDTWEFDGTNWAKVASNGPGARMSHALAFDDLRGRSVMVGGIKDANGGNTFPDTWEWDGVAWQKTADGVASNGGAMVFDREHARMIFSRASEAATNETWKYFTLATPCTGDDACGSGSCQDNLCCAAPCGTCERCNDAADPGHCVPVMGAADPDTCSGDQHCDGSGQCVPN